jgi:hypothetical protein
MPSISPGDQVLPEAVKQPLRPNETPQLAGMEAIIAWRYRQERVELRVLAPRDDL